MDDGSEFTSRKFLDWCIEHKIEMMHISSGKPIEKRHCDSFYGRLREEFLNFPEFGHLFQARQPERGWMMDYDHQRAHSSLGHKTPRGFPQS